VSEAIGRGGSLAAISRNSKASSCSGLWMIWGCRPWGALGSAGPGAVSEAADGRFWGRLRNPRALSLVLGRESLLKGRQLPGQACTPSSSVKRRPQGGASSNPQHPRRRERQPAFGPAGGCRSGSSASQLRER